MYRKINIVIAVLFILPTIPVLGQDWLVPEEDAALENSVEYNLDNVKSGKALYLINCKSCHGDPGKNNALPLVPLPPDVVSEQMQGNTEGGLFYKISLGRGAMPQFETVLSQDERWKVVNYIMNYNPNREAVLIELPPVKAQIRALLDEETAFLEVFVDEIAKSGDMHSLADVPVIISSKKTFGNLEIGQSITDKNGRSEFHVPEGLIGDEQGMMKLVISLNEDYEAEEVILESTQIATPKNITKLIVPGVIWSTNATVPKWILLSFLGFVIGAWVTIGYVIVQIVKIRRLSKE